MIAGGFTVAGKITQATRAGKRLFLEDRTKKAALVFLSKKVLARARLLLNSEALKMVAVAQW